PVQRFDVVNFTEVAEHLKKEHEQQMLENVLGLVDNFLIISWSDQWDEYRGTERQEHFNPRSKRYVRRRLSRLGLSWCKDLTRELNLQLEDAEVYEHWQNSVLVFRKK
ncbi:MAG: hypothetical protein HUJ31_10330, partial [Pseudomonadales bacterium]|nr:hypothetical protein [Pseudomonadales bacterium]